MDRTVYTITFDSDLRDFEAKNTKLTITRDNCIYKTLSGFPAEVCYSMIKDTIEADYSDHALKESLKDATVKDSELEDMEFDLKELKEEIKRKKYDLVFDITGLQSNEISFSDFWKCSKSPTGMCVYDNIEDPAHDSCVFCHEPEDRK